VPKKTKIDQTIGASADDSTVAQPVAGVRAPSSQKRASSTKSGSVKKASKKKSPPRSGKAASKGATKSEPSDAEIRLRAYFIAERRVQLAQQGDPAKDWLEAKRQLLEEAAGRKS
jgi:hypothetical protein